MPQDEFPIIQFTLSEQQINIRATTEALILLQSAIVDAIAQNKSEAELLNPSADVLTVIIERFK